jgi:LysR family transcriptional regulator for metE and metH
MPDDSREGPMSLEIRHLKLMLAVSEDGSLTRAARRLHLTQSALSHQLRDAEKTLGRPLFLREKKQMRLTAAGERLLRSAQEIVDEINSAEREIRESRPGPEGTIRVATECNTCYHWLPAALKTFGEKYPAVDVQVVVEATHQPVPALLDGRIDVGIVSDPVKNSRLAIEALFEDELVAVLPADHSRRRAPFLDAADFADEQLITYDAPREQLTVFQQVLVPAGVRPRRWTPMGLTEAMIEMVRAGLGIGVMARWAAEPYTRQGGLVIKRITRGGLPRQWSAAWVKRRRLPGYLADFVRSMARAARPAVSNLRRTGTHG